MKLTGNPRTAAFALAMMAMLSSWLVLVNSGSAQDKLPPPSGHINDFAAVVDPAGKQRLETVLEKLKERTNVDLIVAIVKTAGAEDLYDYSLRLAGEWNIGTRTNPRKSVLLIITADNGRFFAQFSRAAQTALPDGLIGEMGRRMRPKFEAGDFNGGLLVGIQTFTNTLGEQGGFTFAQLDPQEGETLVAKTRPRTVEAPATPTPATTETPVPDVSPTPTPVESHSPQPTVTPTPETSPSPTPTPTPVETPTPAETPQPEVPSPTPTPIAEPTETPAVATPTPGASPVASVEIAKGPARPTRTPATRPDPEGEKEEVELALTKPVGERVDLLKAFIAAHPKSVAVPRAYELIAAARAIMGDQKLQAGDVEGGLALFRLAMAETPAEMSDRFFAEVIARIPMNLFLRGQRDAAIEAAHRAESLAKLNPSRLVALAQFYLGIEDVFEANRLAELSVQTAPDLAGAHQALGAARHIALRLDDAQAEYSRALALDPKSNAAKLALADLKRASGESEASLTLYREVLQAEPKSGAARAGVILSLLELGRKPEAEQEIIVALKENDKTRILPVLVGAAYWYVAHDDPTRGLELAQLAITIEPRYSWAQIGFARALVADGRPLEAEGALRYVRQFGRFPTMDYELANVLAQIGLYDEAVAELTKSFSLKDGQLETKLAGRVTSKAANFTDLLALERRAAIFQNKSADSEANAKIMRGLLAFVAELDPPGGRSPKEEAVLAAAQEFIGGNDPMRTYRQVYVASKLLRKGLAYSSVLELMDGAMTGVEAALRMPTATIAVQPDELADERARALSRGTLPALPQAARGALSGILRGRIEDLAGMALFNMDKPVEAVARLRLAVSVIPPGTPLARAATWHLGAALEAAGKNDQALLYYIKSYLAGPPDPVRRAVIENVYKKVNGTLDGLDDKIGPGFSASPSPTPTRTPD
ncbi:MAG TPA: TPM domain-containing protein [Pyrinomonadaceae bacterium]|nr:TPM domain-containing protein [Pyrinomonadaceae bacterium]